MPNRPDSFKFFLIGGAFLSATAGFVDAATILAPGHLAVSHVTGSVAKLAVATASDYKVDTHLVLFGVGAFIIGSAISGAVLDSTQLKVGRRYGFLLAFEGMLLAVAATLLSQGASTGVILAAVACGLQNAMATQYSGAIVRTTHVTGLVTDIGISLGKWVSRRNVEGWRVVLYLTLALSFAGGAFGGAELYSRFGGFALYGPAMVISLLGIGYTGFLQFRPRGLAE